MVKLTDIAAIAWPSVSLASFTVKFDDIPDRCTCRRPWCVARGGMSSVCFLPREMCPECHRTGDVCPLESRRGLRLGFSEGLAAVADCMVERDRWQLARIAELEAQLASGYERNV
jgi:hypothetical protein